MSPTPITQRDVAHACGLHPSTVCLALKNSPSIPAETRQRVQAVASALGYQPNVAARNLALLRTERKPAASLPLAWINQEIRRDHWRSDAEARAYFEGARRRAEEAGYHLEEIWTREPGMSAARIVHILHARGVEGVIFPAHRSFDFSLLDSGWGEFAMVGCNDHRLSEWLDVVCPDDHRNTQTALRALHARGFNRIGLVLTSHFDAATAGLVHGAFLRDQAQLSPAERVPVLFAPENAAADVMAEWIHEHAPDAVVSSAAFAGGEWNARGELEVPLALLRGDGAGCDAWIDARPREIAAAAVDCVVEKIRRFDKGPREATRVQVINGLWHEHALARRERHSVVA